MVVRGRSRTGKHRLVRGAGAGARYLAPLFERRNAWRVLDAGIAVVMITLAVLLVA